MVFHAARARMRYIRSVPILRNRPFAMRMMTRQRAGFRKLGQLARSWVQRRAMRARGFSISPFSRRR